MQTERINEHIEKIDEFFRSKFNKTEHEHLLGRTVKLGEEVGELCEAVLNDNAEQIGVKNTDLPSEVADVIISTLLIAKVKDLNVWDEVEKKLKAVRIKNSI